MRELETTISPLMQMIHVLVSSVSRFIGIHRLLTEVPWGQHQGEEGQNQGSHSFQKIFIGI